MRRASVGLDEITSWDTLTHAFWRASRGRQATPAVEHARSNLDPWLAELGGDLRAGHAPEGRFTEFVIHDPKRRTILAPCFRDRVAHHAVMAHLGPVLDRALVHDTYACREGKGALAAVHRAQHHLRRHPWFVKADIRAFFASVDHAVLMSILGKRMKHPDTLDLCGRILRRAPVAEGRGLPIGALTSQHFANTYLGGLDRFLLETLRVRGMVRYMDDVVWWCASRRHARETRTEVMRWGAEHLRIEVKPTAQVGRSEQGVSFLGFRIHRGTLRLSRRRRRRYAEGRRNAERAWLRGELTGAELQQRMDAVIAITAHAEAAGWRRADLRRTPPVDA